MFSRIIFSYCILCLESLFVKVSEFLLPINVKKLKAARLLPAPNGSSVAKSIIKAIRGHLKIKPLNQAPNVEIKAFLNWHAA
jgi:hypothetical protein